MYTQRVHKCSLIGKRVVFSNMYHAGSNPVVELFVMNIFFDLFGHRAASLLPVATCHKICSKQIITEHGFPTKLIGLMNRYHVYGSWDEISTWLDDYDLRWAEAGRGAIKLVVQYCSQRSHWKNWRAKCGYHRQTVHMLLDFEDDINICGVW